ncbi:DUF4358 domain-containing protein [Paenibacillus sp. FSL W8-0919]
MINQLNCRRRISPLILAIVVAICVLSGCSGKDDKMAAQLTASEVGEQIMQAVDLEAMREGDQEKLQKLYKLDLDGVEDFILYTSTSNVKADEWAVIKLKDPQEAEAVKEKVEARINEQTAKFRDYRPDEYFLVENHVLKVKGPFVFIVVSKEADRMGEAFDDALTQGE